MYVIKLFYSLLLISITSNTICLKRNNESITAVTIESNQQILDFEGGVINYHSSYKIYFKGKIKMFEYTYRKDSAVNEAQILSEEITSYFIFHSDSSSGINYDETKFLPDNVRLPVDSMLNIIRLGVFGLELFLIQKPDSFYYDKRSESLIEVYNVKGTKDNPDIYTTSLFFSKKLNSINESFSEALDSSRGMKFYKRHVEALPYFDSQYNMQIPARKGYYEMKITEVQNKNEINEIFKKYDAYLNK